MLWGLKAIPWYSGLTKYVQGAPDGSIKQLYNEKGEPVKVYLRLENPRHMHKEHAILWFNYILASENAEIPEEEALCFIAKDKTILSVYGTRQLGSFKNNVGEELDSGPAGRMQALDMEVAGKEITTASIEEESMGSDMSFSDDDDNMSGTLGSSKLKLRPCPPASDSHTIP